MTGHSRLATVVACALLFMADASYAGVFRESVSASKVSLLQRCILHVCHADRFTSPDVWSSLGVLRPPCLSMEHGLHPCKLCCDPRSEIEPCGPGRIHVNVDPLLLAHVWEYGRRCSVTNSIRLICEQPFF